MCSFNVYSITSRLLVNSNKRNKFLKQCELRKSDSSEQPWVDAGQILGMEGTWQNFCSLTLKPSVSQRFPTETFVVFHSVDYDGSAKNVRQNKNVGLLQAGPGLGEREMWHIRKLPISSYTRMGTTPTHTHTHNSHSCVLDITKTKYRSGGPGCQVLWLHYKTQTGRLSGCSSGCTGLPPSVSLSLHLSMQKAITLH